MSFEHGGTTNSKTIPFALSLYIYLSYQWFGLVEISIRSHRLFYFFGHKLCHIIIKI